MGAESAGGWPRRWLAYSMAASVCRLEFERYEAGEIGIIVEGLDFGIGGECHEQAFLGGGGDGDVEQVVRKEAGEGAGVVAAHDADDLQVGGGLGEMGGGPGGDGRTRVEGCVFEAEDGDLNGIQRVIGLSIHFDGKEGEGARAQGDEVVFDGIAPGGVVHAAGAGIGEGLLDGLA